jgi:putative ABC transport system permease protein
MELATAAGVGLGALRAHPLRTLLSTLGVILGVGSIVAVLAMGDGVEVFARDQVARTTDLQAVSIAARTTEQLDGVAVLRSNPIRFGARDIAAFWSAVPQADAAILSWSGTADVVRSKGTTRHGIRVTALVGASASRPARLAGGKMPADSEWSGAAHVVVLNSAAASLVSDGAPLESLVGSELLVGGRPFRVAAVLGERGSDRAEAFIPIGAATGLDARAETAPRLTLHIRSVDSVAIAVRRLEAWIQGRYGPRWRNDLELTASIARLQQWSQAILIFKLLMGAITGVSLVVGGIGIMNVLLAAVVERTREIGIRRATGARKRDVLVQFLSESIAITAAGSGVGLIVGSAVAWGTAALMRQRTGAPVYAELGISTVLIAVGASVGVGVLFGLYPALRAARLSPIDAIRHE